MIMVIRIVLVVVFCVSLIVCGGGSGSNSNIFLLFVLLDLLFLFFVILFVIDEFSEVIFNIIGYDGEIRVFEIFGLVLVMISNNNFIIMLEDIFVKEGLFIFIFLYGNKKIIFFGKILNNFCDSKNSVFDGFKEESLIIIDNEEFYKVILCYIE